MLFWIFESPLNMIEYKSTMRFSYVLVFNLSQAHSACFMMRYVYDIENKRKTNGTNDRVASI